VNWTTTSLSSSSLRRALAKFSGCSLLVISRFNHERSALARASPTLYQCRLLALTLPTTTLFLKTTSAAISPAVGAPALRSPLPRPVETDDPSVRYFLYGIGYDRSGAAAFDDDIRAKSDTRYGTGMVRGPQIAYEIRLYSGINPIKNMKAASRPIGPAPVTRTVFGSQKARRPIVDLLPRFCDDVVGSSKTPRSPSELSTFIAYGC